jgi:hypothetical protein
MQQKEIPKSVDWKGLCTAGVFFGGLVWAAHHELGNLDDRIAALDKHISRVETAVRIMGAKQGGDTKTLIDEALTVAKNASDSGHSDDAKVAMDIANRLLQEQELSREPATQQFFDSTVQKYQSLGKTPALADSALDATVRLAQYRSAVTPPPSNYVALVFTYPVESQLRLFHNTKLVMGNFDVSKVPGDAFVMQPEDNPLHDIDVPKTSKPLIMSGFLVGGRQTLDDIQWSGVTFVDMRVKYNGGYLSLNNVRFINCTFDVPPSKHASRFVEYAALAQSSLTIG